jgi:cell division protein FtsQ
MPVAAPADKRFRRAHISPAKRKATLSSWRPHWRIAGVATLVCAVGVYGLSRLVDLAMAAEALTVTRITVSGNSRISRGEVLALLEGIQGASMVTADLEAWRLKLLSSPWVADAALRRELPGTLTVVISERDPIGIGRIGDTLYLIDQRGTIIDEFGPNYAVFDLPIIDGLAAAPQPGGALIDPSRAALAGRLLAELQGHPRLAGRVSQIDVTDVRDAAVILKSDTVLVRVGTERFAQRIQSYLDLAPALRDRVPDIDYVDLRFDERIYVRPHAGAGLRTPGSAVSGRTR